MNIAVITGASSGIGEQFLRQLVRERSSFGSIPFEEIWVIARRADRLLALKNELDPVRIRIFMIDLTAESAIDDIAAELKLRNPTIGILVNCAGMGKNGRFETILREDVHNMVALNCAVLAEFTSACLPYMIPNGDLCSYPTGPRILNIASSAGFLPQPGFAAYAASKSFVISFSRALHAELRVHNIASTTVCPGPVATEFASVATGVAGAETKGFKSLFVVKPERLVRKSIIASKKGRGLYVYGFSQKCLHVLTKILPTSFLVFLVTKLSPEAKPPHPPVTEQSPANIPDTQQQNPAATSEAAESAIQTKSAAEAARPVNLPAVPGTVPTVSVSAPIMAPSAVSIAAPTAAHPGVPASDQAAQILSKYPGKYS